MNFDIENPKSIRRSVDEAVEAAKLVCQKAKLMRQTNFA